MAECSVERADGRENNRHGSRQWAADGPETGGMEKMGKLARGGPGSPEDSEPPYLAAGRQRKSQPTPTSTHGAATPSRHRRWVYRRLASRTCRSSARRQKPPRSCPSSHRVPLKVLSLPPHHHVHQYSSFIKLLVVLWSGHSFRRPPLSLSLRPHSLSVDSLFTQTNRLNFIISNRQTHPQ